MKSLKWLFPFVGNLFLVKSFFDEGDGGDEGDEGLPPEEGRNTPEPEEPELPADFDAKRVYGENKRKGEKITALEKELEELRSKVGKPAQPSQPAQPVAPEKPVDVLELAMQNPETAKAITRYKERFGADDDDVRAQLIMSGYAARQTVDGAIAPINETMADQHLEKTKAELAAAPEFKYVIDKYGDEIKSFLIEKKVDRKWWGNKDFLTSIIGTITMRHLNEIKSAGSGKKIDREVLGETGGGQGAGAGSAGVDWNEVKAYALEELGYSEKDLADKDVKKSVIAAFQAMKKAQS